MRAIIFDAEGVIVHTEDLWDESSRVFLERRGIASDRSRVKHLMAGRSLADGVRILRRFYELPGDIQELAAERRTIAGELFESGVEFVPGFSGFFERVVAARFRTCVATSMEPALFETIDRRLRIRARFGGRVYFTADVDGRAKPDPAIFEYAARAVACAPRDCLVIEDSPAGVAGAKAAGMQCVALATTFTRELLYEADLVCPGFAQIPELTLRNP